MNDETMRKIYDEQTVTDYKIAKEIGIQLIQIYRIDDCQRCDIRLLLAIAKALNLDPGDLAKKIVARWDRKNSEKQEYVGKAKKIFGTDVKEANPDDFIIADWLDEKEKYLGDRD